MPWRRAVSGHATGCDRMMIKAVTIFLVGMAILAMFGKLRLPYIGRVSDRKSVV